LAPAGFEHNQPVVTSQDLLPVPLIAVTALLIKIAPTAR
jgi:hypothetical protein